MNTKNVVIAIGLVIVLALGMTFPRGNTVVQQVANGLGAATGPDNYFNCETHNGVQTCFSKQSFKAATSTPVDMLSPTATSSLTYASCNYKGSAGAAVDISIWKGATLNATTTLLAQRNLATPGIMNFPLVASTTPPAAAETTLMFPPSNHLVFQLNGVAGVSLTGSCSAEWKTI
jgi:hypothetical protein